MYPIRKRAVLHRALAAALILMSAGARADDQDLPSFSLEQLSDVVVTSVSRQEERLANAAASIYIISATDIARSGARTLPEALRLAPNLQVARGDARNYAVTARGFNSVFQNKLLVLIDGRSVYSPLFSGVFWDAQDVMLGDIERIEVISGPGATIYGANAVNGVINVITKSSKDTQKGIAVAGISDGENVGGVRYGGRLPNGHFRAYAKAIAVDDTLTAAGVDTNTGYERRQAGARADWELGGGHGLRLSGDVYEGRLGQTGTRDIRISGANLTSSLDMRLGEGSDLHLGLIFDHTERNQPNAFTERLDTVDLSLQHNLRLGERHRIAWGAGYRHANDQVDNGPAFGFLPGNARLHWGNVFAQDEIALSGNLKATVGLKLEDNHYTGVEHLPNVRLAWQPTNERLVWGSLARTVRAPSRIDRDFYAPTRPAVVDGVPRYAIAGGPDFLSEVVNVAELGYREQLTGSVSYSVTAYYSDYDRLRTLEPQAGGSVFLNMAEGRGRGIEAWWRWQPSQRWRLSGGGVIQSVDTSLKAGSRDGAAATGLANNDPRRQLFLRSYFDLSDAHQIDFSLRYNSGLPRPVVPAYTELDVQWTWKLHPDWEVALIGNNLLHSSHAEFGGPATRSVFERSAMLKLARRF